MYKTIFMASNKRTMVYEIIICDKVVHVTNDVKEAERILYKHEITDFGMNYILRKEYSSVGRLLDQIMMF